MTSKVVFNVIGRPGCMYCDAVKKALSSYGFEFSYSCVTQDEDLAQWFRECGYTTYPQVFKLTESDGWWSEEYIGGYDDTVAHLIDLI